MHFQELEVEKVLHLVKMYINYWKSMEIPNLDTCLFISSLLMIVLQMFLQWSIRHVHNSTKYLLQKNKIYQIWLF